MLMLGLVKEAGEYFFSMKILSKLEVQGWMCALAKEAELQSKILDIVVSPEFWHKATSMFQNATNHMLLCIPSSSACSETQGQSNHSLLGCLSRKTQTTGSVQEL